MPLELGNFWDLEEQPLAGGILEARLEDAEFHSSRRMNQDLGQLCLLASPNLPPNTFTEIDDAGPNGSSPAHITEAHIGIVEGESIGEAWKSRSTYEAADGVGVETDHEEEGEMMSVPKRLEALLADFVVRSAVHDNHDEEHDMSGYSGRLAVVNVEGVSRSELTSLDIDKVDIMGGGMDHGPKCKGISHLAMEPNVLVGGEQPSHLWTNDTEDIPQHGDQNEESINGEYKTCTTGYPDGEMKSIKTFETGIGVLRVPSIGKDSDMHAIPEYIEQETSRSENLSLDPFFYSFRGHYTSSRRSVDLLCVASLLIYLEKRKDRK